jgi:hypothetical protein
MLENILTGLSIFGGIVVLILAFIGGQFLFGAVRFASQYALANMRATLLSNANAQVRSDLSEQIDEESEEPVVKPQK